MKVLGVLWAMSIMCLGCGFEEFEPTIDGPVLDAAPSSDAPDADTSADAEPSNCPSDMVLITQLSTCIDRYEASRGTGGKAQSIAGVWPWVAINWDDAGAACAAAGKRLCEKAEWVAACSGPPPGNPYPYGDTYDPDACNQSLPPHAVAQTGSMAGCEGGYSGIFDMSGNVWEWTGSCAGTTCHVAGGAFDWDDMYLACVRPVDPGGIGLPATEMEDLGFRCCLSPEA